MITQYVTTAWTLSVPPEDRSQFSGIVKRGQFRGACIDTTTHDCYLVPQAGTGRGGGGGEGVWGRGGGGGLK